MSKDQSRIDALADVRALLADLEAAQKDAERYRWLRAEHERHDPVCHLSWKQNSDRNGSEWVNTANLDAAIDAALAQMAQEPVAVAGASLLRQPVSNISEISKTIPGGCYCPPGICQAPIIMGRQTPCMRRDTTPPAPVTEGQP